VDDEQTRDEARMTEAEGIGDVGGRWLELEAPTSDEAIVRAAERVGRAETDFRRALDGGSTDQLPRHAQNVVVAADELHVVATDTAARDRADAPDDLRESASEDERTS
jgi:hypothetical protein